MAVAVVDTAVVITGVVMAVDGAVGVVVELLSAVVPLGFDVDADVVVSRGGGAFDSLAAVSLVVAAESVSCSLFPFAAGDAQAQMLKQAPPTQRALRPQMWCKTVCRADRTTGNWASVSFISSTPRSVARGPALHY
jgi:hypothetical protein